MWDLLEIEEIRNTQRTIQNRIDGGAGRQVPLLPWACDLLLGSLTLARLPMIRVSYNPRDGKCYSIDNRRCFVLKVLCLEEPLEVKRVEWSHEFQCKLHGDGGGPWRTDPRGVQQFRLALLHHLNKKTYPDPEWVQHVFIPVGLFGKTLADVLIFFELYADIDETVTPSQGFCPSNEVYLTINKWKRPPFNFFGSCAIDLRIERACEAEAFEDLCSKIRAVVQREVSKRM